MVPSHMKYFVPQTKRWMIMFGEIFDILYDSNAVFRKTPPLLMIDA